MKKLICILCIAIVFILVLAGFSSNGRNSSANENTNLINENNDNLPIDSASSEGDSDIVNTTADKIAYITIDDGPSVHTLTYLHILKNYNVKATFFVLPKENLDDMYKQIIAEGHEIANHSYSHNNDIYKSDENFEKDILKARDFIYNKFNYKTTVFRFPGGSSWRKKSVIASKADILKKNGYRYFDWDVSVADTDPKLESYGDENTIVNMLINNVVKNTRDKKKLIILMHDSFARTYTQKALPCIINGLKEQGYTFDVLSNYGE